MVQVAIFVSNEVMAVCVFVCVGLAVASLELVGHALVLHRLEVQPFHILLQPLDLLDQGRCWPVFEGAVGAWNFHRCVFVCVCKWAARVTAPV